MGVSAARSILTPDIPRFGWVTALREVAAALHAAQLAPKPQQSQPQADEHCDPKPV